MGGDRIVTRALVALCACAAVLVVPSGAQALPPALTITTGAHFAFGDDDPFPLRAGPANVPTIVLPLAVVAGNDVTHLNRDLEGHNLTSVLRDENGAALFAGVTIGQNEVTTVVTSHLPPGDYPFICTIHSEFMQGTLTVS